MDTENQQAKQTLAEKSRIINEVKTLEITDEVSTYMNEAGKWGKFLAILGFVFMGLLVAGGFVMSIVFALIPTENFGGLPFPTFLIGVFYLIIGAIYFLPILYLYRFSTGIRMALSLKNQRLFSKAFYNLKALYRFIGIFMIVIFAIYLLMIVIMIFAGLFAGFSNYTGMQA
ncbi:hypothetical protein GM418_17120 [Maribellus comscasis]|uniref:Uncharacterized protein n=1 Tax=Maribellus comscasis TaxID=2681766 RepID=A0A6I6JYR7_9BACT|nr:hypothetical protein [Maribellus comscasis]QGY45332.1 hypothetical protein GM418_17120 [Maribellus comscasis]